MISLAIDPGDVVSGWVLYDSSAPRLVAAAEGVVIDGVRKAGVEHNDRLLKMVRDPSQRWPIAIHALVLETFRPRGQPMYSQLIETARYTGRLQEAWWGATRRAAVLITREGVKTELLGAPKGSDANVRAALVDLFGGKDAAIGSAKRRGPLYGLAGDSWQALALAIAHAGAPAPRLAMGGVRS